MPASMTCWALISAGMSDLILLRRHPQERRSSASSACYYVGQRFGATFQMDIITDTTKSSDETASTAKTSSGQSVPASQSKEIYEGVPIPLLKKLYRGITYPIRLLPDFMIIGTQRGGTTSLYRYLKTHPSVGATSNKDLHFFDRRFSKGLSWYQGHF